jgi:hypothetical protein
MGRLPTRDMLLLLSLYLLETHPPQPLFAS